MKQSNQAAFFMMNKIALIYMGGTFGCIGEPLAPMPELEFFQQLQKVLPAQTEITCFSAAMIKDSSACSAADWLLLIQQIQQLQLQDYNRFVIIHGTDTLSYATATLARFLQQSSHIIFTGSQFPLLNTAGTKLREFSDAYDNLKTALQYIQDIPAGVYLAFNHKLLHGSSVHKLHSTDLNAFFGLDHLQALSNENSNAMGVTEQHIERIRQLDLLNLSLRPIESAQFHKQLEHLLAQPPEVLILQAYGTGNLAMTDEILQLLEQLSQKDCRIILDSQVPFGGLDQRYAVSQWVKNSQVLVNDTQSHADLYAKIVKMYLQYPTADQWQLHWYDHSQ